jgi:hypothetical protein
MSPRQTAHYKWNTKDPQKEVKKMETRKITTLFAVFVLTLGGMGFTFAHWNDYLYIKGVVDSGEVCVCFSDYGSNDPCDPVTNDPGLINVVTDEHTFDDGYRDEWAASGDYYLWDKNVACTDVHNSPPPGECPKTIYIDIDNSYPSYAPYVWFNIYNCGTIPVYLTDFVIQYDGLEGTPAGQQLDLDGFELIAWEVTLDGQHLYGESKGDYTNLPITVDQVTSPLPPYNMHNLIGYLKTVQLDPEHYIDVHLVFHVEQWIEQDSNYCFSITTEFTQWNLANDGGS